jgi:hypothetical protein
MNVQSIINNLLAVFRPSAATLIEWGYHLNELFFFNKLNTYLSDAALHISERLATFTFDLRFVKLKICAISQILNYLVPNEMGPTEHTLKPYTVALPRPYLIIHISFQKPMSGIFRAHALELVEALELQGLFQHFVELNFNDCGRRVGRQPNQMNKAACIEK